VNKVIQIVMEPCDRGLLLNALTSGGRIWIGSANQLTPEGKQDMQWTEVVLPPDCTYD